MGKRADARRKDSRRRALRILPLAAALVVLALGGGAALAHWQGREQAVTGAAQDTVRPLLPPSPSPEAADPEAAAPEAADPEPRTTPSAPSRNRPPVPEPPAKQKPSAKVPASGAGTFTTARGTGRPSGSGTLRRYRVQVEDGVDIPAKDAAAEIEQILAHPRGWGAHGRGSFQLVETEADADFVIRIATPATADSLCLKQGLDTHGELNCETTDGVVVNLRRWMLGSPTFKGTPDEYRHLIINHEVGHEIGISRHLGCGGPGRLAPVMMQQIKGLDGCRSNAWPYDEDGTYITGPEL
ncbi:DUF3152 domain-containing protein [Streptomyces sp. NBC_01481]|uniref:DUF3152 domain-containing protein n=1 Tax=Streptomyces sp. NBC_01481 TaxID=2975869 RepID=UPI002257AAB6|nr:DUF3152 domain-containing protein [Streptomyces sp. NBC_01481]MCX4583878.1 DUF3152 domain-containing protein [Streptomyces sp. NBC_01481]